jgi:hypothetical protein
VNVAAGLSSAPIYLLNRSCPIFMQRRSALISVHSEFGQQSHATLSLYGIKIRAEHSNSMSLICNSSEISLVGLLIVSRINGREIDRHWCSSDVSVAVHGRIFVCLWLVPGNGKRFAHYFLGQLLTEWHVGLPESQNPTESPILYPAKSRHVVLRLSICEVSIQRYRKYL